MAKVMLREVDGVVSFYFAKKGWLFEKNNIA